MFRRTFFLDLDPYVSQTRKLGIFGSIHSAEMMKQFGLDDNMVMELFDRFKPDIVCGSV